MCFTSWLSTCYTQKTTSNHRNGVAHLLSDSDGFDVGSEVEPQGEEARQGLEDVAGGGGQRGGGRAQ